VPTQYKRNAQILTLIDTTAYPDAGEDRIGKPIPATFGLLNNSNFFAKALRVADSETVMEPNGTLYLFTGTNYMINTDILAESSFPVVGNDGDIPPIRYNIKIGSLPAEGGATNWFTVVPAAAVTTGSIDLTDYFDKLYLKIIDGTGQDKSRKITSAIIADVAIDPSVLQVTVADYVEETLAGNAAATASEQSWCQFVDIARQYALDTWPSYGFLNSLTGLPITTGLELYAYSDSQKSLVNSVPQISWNTPYQFMRLPQYAYTEVAGGTAHNLIDIDVKLFNGSVDNMDSFLILPVVSPTLLDSADAGAWFDPSYKKIVNGHYCNDTVPNYPNYFLHDVVGSLSNIVDKNDTTQYGFYIQLLSSPPEPSKSVFIILFNFPALPVDFDFDSCYVLPAIEVRMCNDCFIRWRRWVGSHDDSLTFTHPGAVDDNTGHWIIKGVPDFYLSNAPANHNRFFFVNQAGVDGGDAIHHYTSGYANFELTGVTTDNYKSISRGALLMQQIFDTIAGTADLPYSIYELSVAFRKTVNIKNDLYTPYMGRVFWNDWGSSRRVATDLISNLGDLYEHVCRLQNGSETGSVVQPGKAYWPSALINTTSFDAADQAYLYDMTIGFQIFDEKLGWTEALKREIARAGFFIGYTNELGQESIATMQSTVASITDTVTLAHVPEDEKIGDVKEPDVKNIYCEPYVRYQYNAATEKYNKIIRITNIQAASWTAAYTPGIDATNGLALWNKCKALYTKYQHLESPPAEMTDQYMFPSDIPAIAFLGFWIDWMAKRRIDVPVYYAAECPGVVRTWHVGRHIYLNLPHQTNGAAKECIIERITKNKEAGVITLGLVIL